MRGHRLEAEFDRCVSVEDKVLHVYALWMPRDRGKVEVRCRTGSAAEATRPVLVDRIKDRISEQTVNIPVPRIIGHRGRCAGHTTRAPDPEADFVERVKAMPQERISDRIVEQLVEHPVTRYGHEIVEVMQVLRGIVEVARLAPQERVQRWVAEHIVAVPGPRSLKGNVEVASLVLHEQNTQRLSTDRWSSSFASCRTDFRTFCCCASAPEIERHRRGGESDSEWDVSTDRGSPVPPVAEQFTACFVPVRVPRILRDSLDVTSVVLHVRISERICRHLVGSPFSTSGRAVSRTFCCCASASEFERNC